MAAQRGQSLLQALLQGAKTCSNILPNFTKFSFSSRRRSSSSRCSTASLGEDGYGTTFVELIKRHGTHLGVIVTGGQDTGLRPRIADLVAGSWAHRSNVLAVGDHLLQLNGKDCGGLTQSIIVQVGQLATFILDTIYDFGLVPAYRPAYFKKCKHFGDRQKWREKIICVNFEI